MFQERKKIRVFVDVREKSVFAQTHSDGCQIKIDYTQWNWIFLLWLCQKLFPLSITISSRFIRKLWLRATLVLLWENVALEQFLSEEPFVRTIYLRLTSDCVCVLAKKKKIKTPKQITCIISARYNINNKYCWYMYFSTQYYNIIRTPQVWEKIRLTTNLRFATLLQVCQCDNTGKI